MASTVSGSVQHILISIEEYDRHCNIKKQYLLLHEGIEENLHIPSKYVLIFKLSSRYLLLTFSFN